MGDGSTSIRTWLCVLLVLALGRPMLTTVLCVGADGHVAIEAPHGPGGCDEQADGDHDADERTDVGDRLINDVGGCSDVPLTAERYLLSSSGSPSRDLADSQPAPMNVTIFSSATSPPYRTQVGSHCAYLRPGLEQAKALRSVVLVI